LKKPAYRIVFLLLLSTLLLSALSLMAILGQVSAPAPPGQQPIILVHGYMDSGDAMVMPILKENLVKIGYRASDIYIISFGDLLTTVDSPDVYAGVLLPYVKQISDAYGGKVDLVCHSMGGLVARWCVEKLGGDQYVDDIVTLATPNQGTLMSFVMDWTPACQAMTPGSDFLIALNDGTLAESVEYTAVYALLDEIVTPNSYAMIPSPEIESVAKARNIEAGFAEHIACAMLPTILDKWKAYLD
jgi:pimeloyl-ACP methyl ester carboxylesterase